MPDSLIVTQTQNLEKSTATQDKARVILDKYIARTDPAPIPEFLGGSGNPGWFCRAEQERLGANE